MRPTLQKTLRSRPRFRLRLLLGLALVAIMLSHPAPFLNMLELLSSGVALLLAAPSSEAQLETYIEVVLEDCQAQIKRLQLAWQRLSWSSRMAMTWTFRVFGPMFLLLLLAFAQALLRRYHPCATPPNQSSREDHPC